MVKFSRAESLAEESEWTIPGLRENVFTEYNERVLILTRRLCFTRGANAVRCGL